MIDLLNRIGFKQIAFGGGGGGGGGGGSSDDRREARKKTGQANLAAGKYTGIQSYGGGGNNDNDGRDDRQPTPPPPPPPPPAPAPITYDPYEDASLYDAGGYVQSYSGPDYGGGGGQSDEDTVMSQPVTYTVPAVETNFGTDLVDETPISVLDADMLSKVTRGLGTPTTLGEDNPQLAYKC
jgi:hypothetical protein